MFDLEGHIAEWRRQMLAGGIQAPELLDELEGHLREEFQRRLRSGTEPVTAFADAIASIGHADALRAEFAMAHAGGPRWLRKCRNLLTQMLGIPSHELNFAPDAQAGLSFAPREAWSLRHDYIGTEHLLLGLLKSEDGSVPKILNALGVSREAVQREIRQMVTIGMASAGAPHRFTPRAKRALRISGAEAAALHQADVRPEHIFLGLLVEGGGIAAQALVRLGLDIARARAEILKLHV